MKGDLLSKEHHIVRYVKPSNFNDGILIASEFYLRPKESGFSVNWLEFYSHLDKKEQLAEIRKLSRLSLRPSGRYAEFNVGNIYSRLENEFKTLKIFHSPLDKDSEYEADPSHSEIAGLPSDDEMQAELVADMIAECVLELHPTVEE